jgi:hypothetical protein
MEKQQRYISNTYGSSAVNNKKLNNTISNKKYRLNSTDRSKIMKSIDFIKKEA